MVGVESEGYLRAEEFTLPARSPDFAERTLKTWNPQPLTGDLLTIPRKASVIEHTLGKMKTHPSPP